MASTPSPVSEPRRQRPSAASPRSPLPSSMRSPSDMSMRELLASCAAAAAVSTPPERPAAPREHRDAA